MSRLTSIFMLGIFIAALPLALWLAALAARDEMLQIHILGDSDEL